MIKSRLVIIVLVIVLSLMTSGCEKSESVNKPKSLIISPSPTLVHKVNSTITPSKEVFISPTIAPTKEPSVTPYITPTLTLEELSMDAYEKFLKNEAKVEFERSMPKANFREDLFTKGQEYTLSEVLDIVAKHYISNEEDSKIEYIDYSYIDCGKDGVKELILRFNGMDIYCAEDDSTLVYIIKYIDGKLSLCYCYETWARSESSINEYGCYSSSGSCSASCHYAESGIIDKDGKWHFIVSMESEIDINQLTWPEELAKLPKVVNEKELTDIIELSTIGFQTDEKSDDSDEEVDKEYFYTFYVYNENWEEIKGESIYTNSIYKDIFDEALIPFITPDEVLNMVAEKEKLLGITPEIHEGADTMWKTLDGKLFSDYVKR